MDRNKHLVLTSVHPSPLSAHRGWFDCGHFKKTNEWLIGRYGEGSEIDWNLDPHAKERAEEARKKAEEQAKKDKETAETLKALEAIEALEDDDDDEI